MNINTILQITFLQFMKQYHLSVTKALQLLNLRNAPSEKMELVNYGDILSLEIKLNNGQYITREIDVRLLQAV